jgi:hypothetical protein
MPCCGALANPVAEPASGYRNLGRTPSRCLRTNGSRGNPEHLPTLNLKGGTAHIGAGPRSLQRSGSCFSQTAVPDEGDPVKKKSVRKKHVKNTPGPKPTTDFEILVAR